GRGTWAVRAIPARQRWSADWRVTSLPSNQMVPSSAGRSPATRVNRVVLPAPLGPTMPRAPPASTSSDMSSITFTPKDLTTPWTWMIGVTGRSGGWSERLQLAVDGDVGQGRVLDDRQLERVVIPLEPLAAHQQRLGDPTDRTGREVDLADDRVEARRADRVAQGRLVAGAAGAGQRVQRHLEQRVGEAERLGPLPSR